MKSILAVAEPSCGLRAVGAGSAIARVTATDPGGLTATQPVAVTVGQGDTTATSNPDLVVDPPGASSPSVAPAAPFTLSATRPKPRGRPGCPGHVALLPLVGLDDYSRRYAGRHECGFRARDRRERIRID